MAFVSASKSRVLIGDFNFSVVAAKVSAPWVCQMLNVTTLADSAKVFIPGQDKSTASLDGWLDSANADADGHFDQLKDFKAAAAAEPFTFGHQGLTLGDPVQMLGVLSAGFATGSKVGDRVTFKMPMQATGDYDMGVSLKDLTAVTVDTDGTGYDGTAATSGGGVGHLHVSAFSGFSQAVVTIADSADNVSFATIVTFSTVTGLTSQRSAITGAVRRYLRYSVDVTGSGSITFAVSFARR